MSPDASAARFVEEARRLVGVKWRHRGRSLRALDCVGLIAVAAKAAGLAVEDAEGYGREPWEDRLRDACRVRWGAPVPDPQPGDVAIFRWGAGKPSHLGILAAHPLGGLSVIHANNLLGVVECRLGGRYARGLVEVYRPRFG